MPEEFLKQNIENLDIKKRQTAFKFRIAEISKAEISNDKPILEIEGVRIIRVNIIANIIDKFISEGERKFGSLTIDDGSGQIRVKVFGDDIEKINQVEIGDTVLIIGTIRFFNNELYILPEIVRKVDSKWLHVRKLELPKKIIEMKQEKQNQPNSIKQKILSKLSENEEGIDVEKFILEIHEDVAEINKVIREMIDNAEIYEPKPGFIRLL